MQDFSYYLFIHIVYHIAYCVCLCVCSLVHIKNFVKTGQAHIFWHPTQRVVQCLNYNHFMTNISYRETA